MKGGNLSESSDDDADAKAGWVWEGDKETGDWVWSESGQCPESGQERV